MPTPRPLPSRRKRAVAFGRAAIHHGVLAASLLLLLSCGGEDGGDGFTVTMSPQFEGIKGLYDITGTVRFSAPVARGTRATLNLYTSRPVGAAEAAAEASARAPSMTDILTYRIRGLEKDIFFLSMWVDVDGDGQKGPGDLEGFFQGTPASPNLCATTATPLMLERTLEGADFGIGAWSPAACP